MGSVGSDDPGSSRGLPANEYELSPPPGEHVEDSIRGQIRRIFNITFFGHEEDGPQSTHHPRAGLGGSRSQSQSGRPRRLDHGASFYGASLAFPRRLGARGRTWKAIAPNNKYLLMWEQFRLVLAAYSAAITPFEFGFFLTIPFQLIIVDTVVNFFFLAAMVAQFFVAVKDRRTLTLIEDRRLIAKRYFQSTFVPELLGLVPWSVLYNATGAHGRGPAEVLRWMIWCRCFRVVHADGFFEKLERDIRLSYFVVRIAKLLVTMMWCTHVAGCIFYYLATTVPPEESLDTWMGSLVLGSNVYVNFRDLDLGVRYITSLYWAFITISTIGYGDVHPVNPREMVFAIMYVAFGVVLSAYLVGNITALIVKGSPTETYRDKMSALVTYMHRNNLPRGLRHQMRQHIRLQFETRSGEEGIMDSFPVSIRHKVARARFRQTVEGCYLFAECSAEFVDQIVGRCTPEFFMPSEIVVAHKDAGDLMYIICYGTVDEIYMGKDGEEESVETLTRGHALGEVALLCNIPQPFMARVKELCQLLRIEKVVLNAILGNYLVDGRQMVTNLLNRMNDEASKISALAGEVIDLISQQEAEMVMATINAASRGDLRALDHLIKAGSNPNHADYDGRTALHLAASKGYDVVVKYLVHHKVDLNCHDHFGTTPLLEALRGGHDATAQLLASKGGEVSLQDAGSELCNAVMGGNTGLLHRLLQFGVDPNSADYDSRVPLHIAAAEGFLLIARMLVDNGADVFARDRWGNTALDEARMSGGSMPLVQLLEQAMLSKVGGGTTTIGGVEDEGEKQKEKEIPAADHDATTGNTLSMAAAAVAHHVSSSPGGGGEIGEEGAVRGGSVFQGLAPTSARPLARPAGSADYRSQISSRSRSGGGTPYQLEQRRIRRSSNGMGMGFSSEAKRKRVTIYPYHPWAKVRKAGRLIFMPPTLKDLLVIANGQFGEGGSPFTRVLSSDGGEVAMIDMVLEGDRLYVAGEEDPEEA